MARALLDPNFKGGLSLPLVTFYNEVGAAQDIYRKYRLIKATHYKEQTAVGRWLVENVFLRY